MVKEVVQLGLADKISVLSEYIQDLRSTAIYGAKKSHFQDIATIHSAVV